ncbi:type IV pilus biogenesis/stability protein PilW [Lysobacter sp. S4-A87]|uniref:type IV pilus biogenesis/stability protein PilW n=1 Tax=Lysobacter sp. S4-A87 TaxID=2925843 RepID=UPI001F535B72|nr:type IV pilus biogenesis/stability protein PilW [Lysobacter sp. S4-A87]UNK49749.1 type IV pilus biogenesis/stability protein PilW [Lysobacter sp. S4-A87]
MKQPDVRLVGITRGGSGRRTLRFCLFAVTVLVASSACSRLTFVRQDFSRGDTEQVARTVEVSDDKRDKASNARVFLQRAQGKLIAGDYPGTERDARQALKIDPRSVDAYTLMGAAAERSGATAQAGEHYRRAAELAPTSGGALNNYGVWLCGQGQAAESLSWFDRALADTSYQTPAMALANAGSCALRAGQDARAARHLRDAIALDPSNPVALGALAELEFRQGRAFEARAFSERRLAAAPADRNALLLASQIEQKLGDTAAAARYVQRMRAEFPETQGSGMGDDGRR